MSQTNVLEPTTVEIDPFDSASNPTLRAFELWGMVEINAWACSLIKGVGKIPYDPNNPDFKAEQARNPMAALRMMRPTTAIDLFIQPLPECNITNPRSCERHLIAESKEWANITLKSIKELGIDNVREVNGKWARVAIVPNGKTYKNKDGDTKDETTFKFVAFFDNEDACRAAYLSNGGSTPAPVAAVASTPDATEAEKNTALAFLKVIVTNAAKGKTKLADAKAALVTGLASYPTVSKHFTVDSPEVTELLAKAGLK